MSYGTSGLPKDFSVKEWMEKSKQFLMDQFGKENIASAVLHMDEGTPHIRAVIIPIKDGKLSARAFLPDRQAMRDLHTKYYQYTKEVGLEPENRYMHIQHQKVGMFYSNINLALEKTLPGPRMMRLCMIIQSEQMSFISSNACVCWARTIRSIS